MNVELMSHVSNPSDGLTRSFRRKLESQREDIVIRFLISGDGREHATHITRTGKDSA
jgi:hypothetical protein